MFNISFFSWTDENLTFKAASLYLFLFSIFWGFVLFWPFLKYWFTILTFYPFSCHLETMFLRVLEVWVHLDRKKRTKKNLYSWMFCKFLCVYYHLLAHHVSKLLYKINSNIKVKKKKDETFEINFCLMSNCGPHFLTRKSCDYSIFWVMGESYEHFWVIYISPRSQKKIYFA